MEIKIWKGFHSGEVKRLISEAWEGKNLLILHPPVSLGTEFIDALPEGRVEWLGNWEEHHLPNRSGARGVRYPEVPVLGVFTSATTTGHPRLALYSRDNILSSLQAILKLFDEKKLRSVFCYPQPFHTFGLILGHVLALEKRLPLSTGTGRYGTSFHEAWLNADHEGLLTLATPTHMKDLLQYCAEKKVVPAPSYSCVMGGARVPLSLWDDVRGKLRIERPSIGYGATEASPGITHLPPGVRPKAEGDIGYLLDSVRITTATKNGITIEGPSVCLAIVSPEGVTFPQSVCISDELSCRNDRWFYHGRADDVLNRGGEKLPLDKIELELADRLGCEVLAVAVPHERLGHELGVIVQGELNRGLVSRELRKLFLLNFDERYFLGTQTLPRNINMKPDKKKALELILRELGHE